MRQTRGRLHREPVLTAGTIRNQQVISEMIQKDYAYCFLKNVHGSPVYFQRVMYDMLGMIRQLLTFSAADSQMSSRQSLDSMAPSSQMKM